MRTRASSARPLSKRSNTSNTRRHLSKFVSHRAWGLNDAPEEPAVVFGSDSGSADVGFAGGGFPARLGAQHRLVASVPVAHKVQQLHCRDHFAHPIIGLVRAQYAPASWFRHPGKLPKVPPLFASSQSERGGTPQLCPRNCPTMAAQAQL